MRLYWRKGFATVAALGAIAILVTACMKDEGPLDPGSTPGANEQGPLLAAPNSPCTALSVSFSGSTSLKYQGAGITATSFQTCPNGTTPNEHFFFWRQSPTNLLTVTPTGSGDKDATITPNVGWGSTGLRICNGLGLCSPLYTIYVSKIQVSSPWDTTVQHVQPSSSGSLPFLVQNVGAGNTTFTMACSATGRISCNGITVQPSPSTLGTNGSLVVDVPYTTGINTGSGSLTLTAGGISYTLQVLVSNNTGQPLDANISGPTDVQTGTTCTWSAAPWGGTTPYHYSWNIAATDSPSVDASFRREGTSLVSVTVSDDAGASVTRSMNVNVQAGWPGCLQ